MDKKSFKDLFRDLFKGEKKRLKTDILAILGIGILLLVLGNTFFSKKPVENISQSVQEAQAEAFIEDSDNTSGDLEKRLESILSKVEGAGTVKVMITTSYSSELVLAEEIKTEDNVTTEKAQQGDERTVESSTYENKIVLLEDSSGSSQPIILKKMDPKIEGVVIVAEGGGDIVVKDSLSKAAQALLNVPAHKVEVFKMKK